MNALSELYNSKIIYQSTFTFNSLTNLSIICSLTVSVGALYVQKYFDETSKKTSEHLVKAIHEEILRTLQTISWMDRNTKIEAIAKAKRMHFHIAYPNELTDFNELNRHYAALELSETNTYLQNILNTRQFNDERYKKKLRQAINKTDWESHSLSAYVNAYYLFDENSICKSPLLLLNESCLSFNLNFFHSITGCYPTRTLLFH